MTLKMKPSSHDKYIKDNDTGKDSLFPEGSTVVMRHEDGGPWTIGIITAANNSDQTERSYIIRVTKMGRLMTWNTRHTCSTPITTEQYIWEQIRKGTG